jgi:hypothetical protein
MCLVALLSAFGMTYGVASFALTVVRPFALVVTALAVALTLRRAWLHRSARRAERLHSPRGTVDGALSLA